MMEPNVFPPKVMRKRSSVVENLNKLIDLVLVILIRCTQIFNKTSVTVFCFYHVLQR